MECASIPCREVDEFHRIFGEYIQCAEEDLEA